MKTMAVTLVMCMFICSVFIKVEDRERVGDREWGVGWVQRGQKGVKTGHRTTLDEQMKREAPKNRK
jgi:hypothetical protein